MAAHSTPRWYEERETLFTGMTLAPHEVPIMSTAERDRRWGLVRKEMANRGVDCLLLVGTGIVWGAGMANVRYLTQLGSGNGAEVLFPIEGEPVAFAGSRHMSVPFHVMRHTPCWVQDVRPRAPVQALAERVKEVSPGPRVGLVGYRRGFSPIEGGGTGTAERYAAIPANLVAGLQELLPDVQWSDETDVLERLRIHKSPEEITYLRRAGEIAKARVERLIETAKPGVTEAQVWAAMFEEQILRGGEAQQFNMMISCPTGDGDGLVYHGLHGVEGPQGPTNRTLEEGDIVLCEFHTQYGGYLAATEFSVVLGRAPEPLRRAHQVCMRYVEEARDIFRPGQTFRTALRTIDDMFEDAGLDWVELGFHGHGLSSPEYPLAVYRVEDMDRVSPGFLDHEYEEGMVVGMNMDVHDPRWRKDVGVMFGDMAHVTGDGGELMVGIPTDVFELV